MSNRPKSFLIKPVLSVGHPPVLSTQSLGTVLDRTCPEPTGTGYGTVPEDQGPAEGLSKYLRVRFSRIRLFPRSYPNGGVCTNAHRPAFFTSTGAGGRKMRSGVLVGLSLIIADLMVDKLPAFLRFWRLLPGLLSHQLLQIGQGLGVRSALYSFGGNVLHLAIRFFHLL